MNDMKHGGNVWEGESPARWLDFSANLRPEGTPAWVMDAMKEALVNTRYYPDRAMREARRGLAEYLDVPEERILPTAGGAAAIDLVLSARRGTVFVCPPTFGEYVERAAAHGRAVGVWRRECRADDTLILCNPNNPTGEGRSAEVMLEMRRKVVERGGELVVDEAFGEFCPENSVRRDVGRGLTVVGSMTKTLCIPGVRLGYLCAAEGTVRVLERRALPWSLSTLASAVAGQMCAHREEIRTDVLLNARRREGLKRELEQMGAEVRPSQGNFLLVKFHQDMTHVAEALRQKNILVRTCASFGLGPEYWRIAVRTEEENQYLTRQIKEVLV